MTGKSADEEFPPPVPDFTTSETTTSTVRMP
jgi:hypothetical protein